MLRLFLGFSAAICASAALAGQTVTTTACPVGDNCGKVEYDIRKTSTIFYMRLSCTTAQTPYYNSDDNKDTSKCTSPNVKISCDNIDGHVDGEYVIITCNWPGNTNNHKAQILCTTNCSKKNH